MLGFPPAPTGAGHPRKENKWNLSHLNLSREGGPSLWLNDAKHQTNAAGNLNLVHVLSRKKLQS